MVWRGSQASSEAGSRRFKLFWDGSFCWQQEITGYSYPVAGAYGLSLTETRWNPSHTNEVSKKRYLDTSPIRRHRLRRKGSIEVSLFCAPEKVYVCEGKYIYIYIYLLIHIYNMILPLGRKGFGGITHRYLGDTFFKRSRKPLRCNGFDRYRRLCPPSLWP